MNSYRSGHGEAPAPIRTRTLANRLRSLGRHVRGWFAAAWRFAIDTFDAVSRINFLPWAGVIAVVVGLDIAVAVVYFDARDHGPSECMQQHEEQRCTTTTTTTADNQIQSSTECHDETVCDAWARSVKKDAEVSK